MCSWYKPTLGPLKGDGELSSVNHQIHLTSLGNLNQYFPFLCPSIKELGQLGFMALFSLYAQSKLAYIHQAGEQTPGFFSFPNPRIAMFLGA